MKHTTTIYLVGNPLINKDAMPFKIKPYLEKLLPEINFEEFDPTENFPEEKEPVFIDTAINLEKPRSFSSVSKFQAGAHKNLSVHGFDFFTELALQKKIGTYTDYTIICVPPKGDPNTIAKSVIPLIKQHSH